MAVSKSPFSRSGGGSTPPTTTPSRFNPQYDTSGLEDIFNVSTAAAIEKSGSSDFVDIGTKTTLGEEKKKLDRAYNTALSRIATSGMGEKEKDRARKMFEDLYKKGKSSESVSLNPFTIGKKIAGGAAGLAGEVFEASATVGRFAQSALKETADLTYQIFDAADTDRNPNAPRAGWSDLIRQTKDKDFRLMPQTGVRWVDATVDFALDVATDPLTYLGVGPLKYVGRAGRTELAVKLGTTEMLAKHPQLVGKLDDILTFGVGAVPREVAKAEGIEFGVRFAGKIIPKTEAIASFVSGRKGITTMVRTGTVNRISQLGKLTKQTGRFTPSSRAGMVAAGLGRGMGIDDATTIRHIADYTSAKAAKGYKAVTYNKNIDSVKDLLREIKKAGAEVKVARLVDDPEAYLREPDAELRALADRYRAWQDGLLEEVNAVRLRFNADFGADMKLINKLDDYGIHHKLTDNAFRFAYGPKGRASGFFKDADLSPIELGNNTGAALHRRYKAGEDFMGEELKTGTIDEINTIFRNKTGQDFDFFETDVFSIADSYAYSMATARAREAYVRRLLDFGSDVAQVINKKLVPDDELVKLLKGAHAGLTAARTEMKRKVNAGRLLARDKAKEIIKFAELAIDEKDAAMSEVNKDIGKIVASLYKVENDLGAAFVRAAEKSDEARGVFLNVHGKLMEDVRVLRTAIEAGRMSEVAAYEALKDVYVRMFPAAKRIPKSASVLLDRVKLNMGIKDTTEIRTLEKQLKALQVQLEDAPNIDPEDLNDLLDLEKELTDKIDGFEQIANVRMNADYAEDGFLYGTFDSIVPKPFDPEAEPMFKFMTTRPIFGSTEGMTSDEIAALRNAMLDDPNTIAVHALDPDEMMDLRKEEDFYEFWNPDNGVGEAVAYALRSAGADPEDIFKSVWDDAMNGVPIDPMFEQVYPELADLMTMVGSVHANVFELGVVSDDFNVEVLGTLRDLFQRQAASLGLENSDQVGTQMTVDFIRAMVEEGIGGKPMLVPARFMDEANDALDGAYTVIMPDNYNYAERFGKKTITDDMMNGAGAPVQTTSGNNFIRNITDGDYHTASLEANELLDAVTEAGLSMQAMIAAREQTLKDVRSTAGKIGGVKAAGSRRVRAAEKAYADYAESGFVTITVGGKTQRMTRDKALASLARSEEKLTNKIDNLIRRIDTITENETGKLVNRKQQLEERLTSLFEQRKVIERWNERTGDALRADIDLLRTAVNVDPPSGWAGTMSRAWTDRVTQRINNIARLEGTGVKDGWERVVLQLHADEAQLALLEFDAIPRALTELTDAQLGFIGGQLKDDILDGWKALESTGIQIPKEMDAIIRPNVEKLRKRAEAGLFKRALLRYNQVFKIYATMTPGFVVRNAMSATFMNKVAGVDNAAIMDGIKAAVAYKRFGPSKWLDELGITDDAERALYETAIRSVQTTGRGIQSDFINPTMRGGFAEKIANNKATRFLGDANEFTENAVRLPMALDSLRRGHSYDEAVMRITRFHFDYTDLSEFDEAAKMFIPFWVWTTRNLPLQLTEQVLRPRYYAAYNNIKERNPASADILMPQWIQEIGPIGLGGNKVLTPDMPMNRLSQTLTQFADPKRLVGQMTPIVKLPIETLIADKQLAMDIPFTDKYEEAKGVDKLIAGAGSLLGLEGVGRRNSEGVLEVNPKLTYSIGNALPSIAALQRITGGQLGGKPTYQERQTSNIANFFGVPYREVGPRQQRGEAINRQFKIREALQKLAREGKIEKND